MVSLLSKPSDISREQALQIITMQREGTPDAVQAKVSETISQPQLSRHYLSNLFKQ
jgi:hypothetical protein